MKQIIFKGKVEAVVAELEELAEKYKGWTVADYIWFASLIKRFNDAKEKQRNL